MDRINPLVCDRAGCESGLLPSCKLSPRSPQCAYFAMIDVWQKCDQRLRKGGSKKPPHLTSLTWLASPRSRLVPPLPTLLTWLASSPRSRLAPPHLTPLTWLASWRRSEAWFSEDAAWTGAGATWIGASGAAMGAILCGHRQQLLTHMCSERNMKQRNVRNASCRVRVRV